jgi:hypothetical protein
MLKMLKEIGVPKHSDLEPHYRLAKRNGKFTAECRLICKDLVKERLPLGYDLSPHGLEP